MAKSEHDPMELLGDPVATPSPWKSLAEHARGLARLADFYAEQTPAAMVPIADGENDHDPLEQIHIRALNLVAIAGACRRATWQTLRDEGMTGAAIAALWDVTPQQVSKTLKDRA